MKPLSRAAALFFISFCSMFISNFTGVSDLQVNNEAESLD